MDPLSSINTDLKLASDTKSHLGAHSFPVLSVVAFWNWFGSPDVDLGVLAGGWGRTSIFTIVEEIRNQLELYQKKKKKKKKKVKVFKIKQKKKQTNQKIVFINIF